MSIKKIYLIRHGQTDYNLQNIVQGSGVNSCLNQTGLDQAACFFRKYEHKPFDKVYTSALQRTIQSVQSFLDRGIPHEAHATLNEICWGKKEGQKVRPEDDDEYTQLIRNWTSGNLEARIEGGENPGEVAARMDTFIDLMLSRPEEKTILICMHGRAMRVLLCRLLHYPIQHMDLFEHHNLCLYRIDYTGSMFTIKQHMSIDHLNLMNELVDK
ncbi:histidine phosphatase family protein [soil metagenome]